MKKLSIVLISFILLVSGILYWKGKTESFAGVDVAQNAPQVVHIGKIATSDKNEICGTVNGLTYSKQHRQTSQALKEEVYKNAGVSYPQPIGKYEVDHIVPLCLGGADELQNLQLQPAEPIPGFHQKDVVEAWACRSLCNGGIDIQTAQNIFTSDGWLFIYNGFPKKVFGGVMNYGGTDNIFDEDLQGKG